MKRRSPARSAVWIRVVVGGALLVLFLTGCVTRRNPGEQAQARWETSDLLAIEISPPAAGTIQDGEPKITVTAEANPWDHLHVLLRNNAAFPIYIDHPVAMGVGYHNLSLEGIGPDGKHVVFEHVSPWIWSRATAPWLRLVIQPGKTVAVDVYLCDERWTMLPHRDERSAAASGAPGQQEDRDFSEEWRLRARLFVAVSDTSAERPTIDWDSDTEEPKPQVKIIASGTVESDWVEVILEGTISQAPPGSPPHSE